MNPPSSTLIDVKKDGGFDEIKTIDVEELRAKREALRGEIKTMDDKKDCNDTLEGVGDSLPIDPELGPPSFVWVHRYTAW